MTKILAIEGTDIRIEVDSCEMCLFYFVDDYATSSNCATCLLGSKWFTSEYETGIRPDCPLPEKVEE
jgi:hypothetical protein